jgi:small conductance mechanosensitive channel
MGISRIDQAVAHLRKAFHELAADEEYKDHILAPLEVSGVTALANSSVNIRVRIMTSPGMQWAVGRAYNRLVKMHFDAAGNHFFCSAPNRDRYLDRLYAP